MLGQVERVTTLQKIVYYLFMGFLALLVIYPFFFMVTTSLKDSPEVFEAIMRPFGKEFRLENYAIVLGPVNMGRYMLNTAFVTFSVVIGQILTSALAVAAAGAGGLDFAGVDLLPDGGRWLVGEVNPTPGWRHFRRATGAAVAERLVAALERRSVTA